MPYTATKWERNTATVVGVGIVVFAMYIVARNEPFRDKDLVVVLRIILSLGIAILGAVVPGFLNVSWKGGGFAIRAGGALALFVLTYLGTPQVTDKLSATQEYLKRLSDGDQKQNIAKANALFMSRQSMKQWTPEFARRQTESWINEDLGNGETVRSVVRFVSEVHSCVSSGACDSKEICTAAYEEIDNFLTSFDWYLNELKGSYPQDVKAARIFRSCDCYAIARENYCELRKLAEWCKYPKGCPFSFRYSLLG